MVDDWDIYKNDTTLEEAFVNLSKLMLNISYFEEELFANPIEVVELELLEEGRSTWMKW